MSTDRERRGVPVLLGAFFFAVAMLLTRHHPVTWNDNSRMATIDALVVHHTFAIDGIATYPTGDKYRYDGRFYSDKPPLLAIAGAAVAFAFEPLGVSVERTPGIAYYLITLALVGTAYAGGLVALYSTLRLRAGVNWSTCVTVLAGLGTLLLPYATILKNHVVSGALAMVGYRLLIDPTGRRRAIAFGGFAMALAASIDIAFAIFFLLAPMLLVRHGLRRTIVPFALAVLPVLALYLGLNRHLSGSFVPPAINLALWQYPGSAFNGSNLTGLAVHRSLGAHLRYAVDLLVGYHGFFAYTPVLILSLYALIRASIERYDVRAEYAFIAVGSAIYVASYVWSSTDYSGFSYGIRWFAGIAFLAMVPLGSLEGAMIRSTPLRFGFLAIACLSSLVAAVGVIDPATPSDRGAGAPFLINAHLFLEGHHPLVKIAACALAVIATTAIVARLVAALPKLDPLEPLRRTRLRAS